MKKEKFRLRFARLKYDPGWDMVPETETGKNHLGNRYLSPSPGPSSPAPITIAAPRAAYNADRRSRNFSFFFFIF